MRTKYISGQGYLYAKGWVYCSRCTKFYPPIFAKAIRCQECSNILRRKSKINKYNRGRDDHKTY